MPTISSKNKLSNTYMQYESRGNFLSQTAIRDREIKNSPRSLETSTWLSTTRQIKERTKGARKRVTQNKHAKQKIPAASCENRTREKERERAARGISRGQSRGFQTRPHTVWFKPLATVKQHHAASFNIADDVTRGTRQLVCLAAVDKPTNTFRPESIKKGRSKKFTTSSIARYPAGEPPPVTVYHAPLLHFHLRCLLENTRPPLTLRVPTVFSSIVHVHYCP